jgi:hypothetical protein
MHGKVANQIHQFEDELSEMSQIFKETGEDPSQYGMYLYALHAI